MTDDERKFAEKLNRLFDTHRKPDGSPYTQDEVVKGTNNAITRVYLWKLRTGRATKPGLQVIQAIAKFFGVDPNYFFEETVQGEDSQLPSTGNHLVDQIALRSSQLDTEGKEHVLDMIDYILKSKKPPPKKPEE